MPLPPQLPDPDTSVPPSPSDALAIERIRHLVVMQIAQASTLQHATVLADSGVWQALLAGIDIKVLHEAQGTLSYLLRLQPGAVLPAHRHTQDEECVVLEGEVQVGDALVIPRGGYQLAKAGALHAPITTSTGCLLFLRGAEPAVGDVL